jgi:cysteine sulfinate desulfinase/cysteine desulfurase-like protein
LKENWHNPFSLSSEGKVTKELINKSRSEIAKMINCKSAEDIIFLSGGTEANNQVFFSCLKHYDNIRKFTKNDSIKAYNMPHFIISNIEHCSVKNITDSYLAEMKAEITEIQVNKYGYVEPEDVIKAIKPNTILISIMLANNETGVIQVNINFIQLF